MSDIGSENPQPSWKNKVYRTLATLGIIGGIGVGANEMLTAPNTEQVKAAAALKDPNIPKEDFKVIDHPDLKQVGGLAVRPQPKTDVPGEPQTAIERLPAGTEIRNAATWTGESPDIPGQIGRYWVTFQDEKGNTVFAALKYLDPVKK